MEEKNRFKKTTLNSDDYAGIEKGAKAAKGCIATVFGIFFLAVKNRENLKVFGKNALTIATKLIRKV